MDLKEGHRLVHLDLKGAPPKISYYEELFPLLRQWGATGLLIEYEDMFPFREPVEILACRDAYSNDEMEKLKSLARENNLLIMPLVQTFGHFEFVLKHKQFHQFREVPNYPMALCPAKQGSLDLVFTMIDQVMEMHPNVPWFHIGADEVYHMGMCPECEGQRIPDIYLSHIKNIARYIRGKYPGTIPVMWDDVYRSWPEEELKGSGVGELVEPMVWCYGRQLNLPPDIWQRYSKVFNAVWFASAFKGATGSSMYLTDIGFHCDNHLSWITVMNSEKELLKCVRGCALTGWQRYDHYCVLCELLPVSIPCLAICLQILANGVFTPEIHRQVSQLLHFKDLIPFNPFLMTETVAVGKFPGSAIHECLHSLVKVNAEYEQFLKDDRLNGWVTPYQMKHNYTSPVHVEHVLFGAARVCENFRQIHAKLKQELSVVFYESTVEEWLGVNVEPKIKQMEQLISDGEKQIKIGGGLKNDL